MYKARLVQRGCSNSPYKIDVNHHLAEVCVKRRIGWLVVLLSVLVSACKPEPAPVPTQAVVVYPPAGITQALTLEPAPATSTPTPSPSATPAPTRTPLPSPSATLPPTGTPQALKADNVARLKPDAIYPLPQRGRLLGAWWTPDGKRILAQTTLGLQVLNTDNLRPSASYEGLSAHGFLTDGGVVVSQGERAGRLDLSSGEVSWFSFENRLQNGRAPLFAASLDGRWLASASADKLYLSDLSSGETRAVLFQLNRFTINDFQWLGFTPDGAYLLAKLSRSNGLVEIAGIETGRAAQAYAMLVYPYADQLEPSFAPDGSQILYHDYNFLATAKPGEGKLLYRASSGFNAEISNTQSARYELTAASFYENGQQAAVLYLVTDIDWQRHENQYTSELIVWDLAAGRVKKSLKGLPSEIVSLRYSPDWSRFLTTSRTGFLKVWDAVSATELAASAPYDSGGAAAISPDGSLVAQPSLRGVHLLRSSDMQEQATLAAYPDLTQVEASFINQNLLAVSAVDLGRERFVEIWDIGTGTALRRFKGVFQCLFSQDGARMVCHEDFIQLYDTSNGRLLISLGTAGATDSVAISPDGELLAFCSRGADAVGLWNGEKGQRLRNLLGDQPRICGPVMFSADGRYLISASGYVWDVNSGELASRFRPQAAYIYDGFPAATSQAGDLLAIGAQVVDFLDGRKLGELDGPQEVRSLAFSQDGMRLVLLTERGVEFWSAY